MIKDFFRKLPVWFKLTFGLIILVTIGYGIWLFMKPPARPPVEFLTARQQGTKISQKIVELTSETNQKIKEINSFDLSGDYLKALSLIEEARNKNQEAYDEAFKLSEEMRKMIESLNKISSLENRQIAMRAISLELALISDFINYTQILNRFLSNLTKAVATSNIEYRQSAEEALSELNAKTRVINSLNQQFLEEMRAFDKSFSL